MGISEITEHALIEYRLQLRSGQVIGSCGQAIVLYVIPGDKFQICDTETGWREVIHGYEVVRVISSPDRL